MSSQTLTLSFHPVNIMATNLSLRPVDPVDIRIFNINWSKWLKTAIITSSSWSVPSPLVNYADSNTTTLTSIKLGGWVEGQSYTVYNTVTTSLGETRRVDFSLVCSE